MWKKAYANFDSSSITRSTTDSLSMSNTPSDPTAKMAILKAHYSEKIDLIEKAAKEADRYLYDYILKAVTEGLSYTYLKSRLGIPCGRDMFYDRYRRFFWILSASRK